MTMRAACLFLSASAIQSGTVHGMLGLRGGIVVDRNAHAGMAMRGTISTKASSAQNVISSGVYRRLEREDDMLDRERWWSAILF